jgi:hypothetical protein
MKEETIEDKVKSLPPRGVLEEANDLVRNQRANSYGPPDQDFTRTAGMLTSLFYDKLKPSMGFSPSDVARIQILLKLSRSTWMSKRDNWVDIAGYSACGHFCEKGEW